MPLPRKARALPLFLVGVLGVAFLVLGIFLLTGHAAAEGGKPTIMKPCEQCHTGEKDLIRGTWGTMSEKAETLSVQIGPVTWIVTYDDETQLTGSNGFNKIEKDKEVAVRFKEIENGVLYATSVKVKPPAILPAEKLISVAQLSDLVAKGPAEGNFTLVDARPGKKFHEGHIPGAISIYDAEFDKNIEKLPKDKSALLVFYCAGPT